MIKTNNKIILASSSWVRKKIMDETKIDYEVINPDYDEEKAKSEFLDKNIDQLALELAKGKALSVSKSHQDAIVIGSDQICEINNQKLDKSKDLEDAKQQLKKLSGKTHIQNNAVAIAKNNEIIFESLTKVKLTMRNLSNFEIDSYVAQDKPIGSAGSYKYESLAKHLFAKVEGDYYSILGMNIQEILNFLHNKNIIEIK